MKIKFPLTSAQIRTMPVVGRIAVAIHARIKGTWRTRAAYWLEALVVAPVIQVVQVGSNDGKTGDPLYRLFKKRRGWKGLFVEPVPYLFDRLKAAYAGSDRFRFENSAITEGKSVDFFWVDESAKREVPDLPEWYDQLGSFDRKHITRHLPQLDPFIRQAQITGITLPELFRKHHITEIGILHIDTEGYDFKVLSQLDLTTTAPQIILFEHKHLSDDERRAAVAFLDPHYQVFKLGDDMLAVSRTCARATPARLRPLRHFLVRPFLTGSTTPRPSAG